MPMRALASLLAVTALLFGVYYFYLKKMPASEEGTTATQAISLTGVHGDLLQIAEAERVYVSMNEHCVSLDELISSHGLSMEHAERDGYSYAVECSGQDFTVTARHAPAPAGSPIRYPNLAMDSDMQVHELH
jgi:hypothetical protein